MESLIKSKHSDKESTDKSNLHNLIQVAADKAAKVESLTRQTVGLREEHDHLKAQMAQKSLKLQNLTERKTFEQALFNQSTSGFDISFSFDRSGCYIFKNANGCCFDITSDIKCTDQTGSENMICKHELCSRIKTTGVSFKEMSTIRWYDTRIRQERTQRMRAALAKQREVELTRIKQSEDEEKTVRAGKQGKKAKLQQEEKAGFSNSTMTEETGPQDVETMIFQTKTALMHAHKYNSLSNVQERNNAERERCADEVSLLQLRQAHETLNFRALTEKLDHVERRYESLIKEAAWYTNKITDAVHAINRYKQSTFWRDFDLDFDLDFESSDPAMIELCDCVNGLTRTLHMDFFNDLELAQDALRHCINVPIDQIPQSMQKSVDHIQSLLLKTRRKSDSKKSRSLHTLNPDIPDCISLLSELRTSLCRLLVPKALRVDLKDLSTMFATLIDVESEALSRIYKEYDRIWLQDPNEIALTLEKLMTDLVGKSPIPQLTEPMLHVLTSTFVDIAWARSIIENLDNTSDHILVAKLSGMVFTRADKKSDWLMEAFRAVEATFETANCQPLPERMIDSLERVRASIELRLKSRGTSTPKQPQPDTVPSVAITAEAESTRPVPSHNACTAVTANSAVQSVENTPQVQPVCSVPSQEAPTVLTASVMPVRKKLLPRGERHQTRFQTTKTAVAVACMDSTAADKVSEFCVLQQKAYERVGLLVPSEVLDRKEYTKRLASSNAGSQSLKIGSCQCTQCTAVRDNLGVKTSKFGEDFSVEKGGGGIEITIDGQPITDDEFLGYTGATVERIHSISRGDAKLEYLCWIAYKVGLDADAAQSAGKNWMVPFRQFEELFTYYAPIPHELELALDHAKGKIWHGQECLNTHAIADWAVIEGILTIMVMIRAKKLDFKNRDDSWRKEKAILVRASDGDIVPTDEEYLAETSKQHSAVWNHTFCDPAKMDDFIELLRRTHLSSKALYIPAFEAAAHDMSQLVREGKSEVCIELLLTITTSYLGKSGDYLHLPDRILIAALAQLVEARKNNPYPLEALQEALDLRKKQVKTEEREIRQRQLETEQAQREKEERQSAAIQAQIEIIRETEETSELVEESDIPDFAPASATTQSHVLNQFAVYDASVRAVTDFLSDLTKEDYEKNLDDARIEIACQVQVVCFDVIRMLQLMAENRGWTKIARRMARCLKKCGFQEQDGHFPDYWDDGDENDDGEEVNGEDVPLPLVMEGGVG